MKKLTKREIEFIQKVGQRVKNANELGVLTINCEALQIEEIREYLGEEDFLYTDKIFDNMVYFNNDIIFTLKDESRWRAIRDTYNCILEDHSQVTTISNIVFQSLDNPSLFKCGDECGKFLKAQDEICNKYYLNNDELLLFPIDWNENGIISWCKKQQKKYEECTEKTRERFYGRQQDYINSIDKDCSNCIHMKNCNCEFGNVKYEDNCEDWEEN